MILPLSAAADTVSNGNYPDPNLSPGVVATSKWEDICETHLSRNRDVTESEKRLVYSEYGITSTNRKWCNRLNTSGKDQGKNAGCEVDHIIPLEDGGSNDIKNLWPQPYAGTWNAHMKDKLENKVHKDICDHKISDADVLVIQRKLADDWIESYKKEYGTN